MSVGRNAQLLGITVCFAAMFQSGLAEEAQPSLSPPPARAGVDVPPSNDVPGMKVYIDPQTGAFLSEPAPGAAPLELSPAERNVLSTSHQGLVEAPSSVPGGGVKLDLQGRFQSPLTATVTPGGKPTIEHKRLDAPASDGK
jgi:hypothetical protein